MQPDFNGAKIAKLANKTEELRIILGCDVLKIIGIAHFFTAGLVSTYAAAPQVRSNWDLPELGDRIGFAG